MNPCSTKFDACDRLFRTLLAAALLVCVPAGCGMIAKGRNVDGVRYFQQGNNQAATQRFQAALQANPRDADGYYNLAAVTHRTALQTSNPDLMTQAESLYNQCLDIEPDHVDCRRGLAVLLTETNRTDRAFVMLKNWGINNPRSSDARVELARLYEEVGDGRSAEIQLTEALQLNVSNWRAHAALGRLKEQAGDYPQAVANYQRAVAINRSQPQINDRLIALQQKYAPASPALPSAAPGFGGTQTATAPKRYLNY